MYSILTNVNQEAWVFKLRNKIKKVYGLWALRLLLNKVQRAKFEANWISRSCCSNWDKQILDTIDSLLRVKFRRNLDKKDYRVNVKTLLCLKCITGINLNRKKKKETESQERNILSIERLSIKLTSNCITWLSFLFTCRLLFVISTPKLVVSRNFLSIAIVLSCLYLLIFYFWEILNLNLTFAVCRIREA